MTTDSDPGWRIAFVLGTASGGTARHVIALADGCRAAGAEVKVFGPAETLGRLPAGVDTLAVEIGDRPRLIRDGVAVVRLRTGIASHQPHVVHAHGVRAGAFAALAGALLTRGSRPALVITVHNAPPAGALSRTVYGLLERICARRADAVLCASADLLTRMRAHGASAAQFDVPAGLQPAPTAADVAAARAGLGAAERPIVLTVGRLASQKGLDVLIDAAGRWRDREPQPRAVIAGTGPLAATLRAQASQVDADVVMLGARDDVPALLAAADIVVVPSRWEARSLVIQEAMRAGRPIVATRVGGTPELTGADGAILVPPEDPAALADAVTALLADASLASRLGAAALRRSAALPTQQDAIRAALAVYEQVSGRRLAGRDGAATS